MKRSAEDDTVIVNYLRKKVKISNENPDSDFLKKVFKIIDTWEKCTFMGKCFVGYVDNNQENTDIQNIILVHPYAAFSGRFPCLTDWKNYLTDDEAKFVEANIPFFAEIYKDSYYNSNRLPMEFQG